MSTKNIWLLGIASLFIACSNSKLEVETVDWSEIRTVDYAVIEEVPVEEVLDEESGEYYWVETEVKSEEELLAEEQYWQNEKRLDEEFQLKIDSLKKEFVPQKIFLVNTSKTTKYEFTIRTTGHEGEYKETILITLNPGEKTFLGNNFSVSSRTFDFTNYEVTGELKK